MFGSSIFFSSATDPYQYAELKYRLSRACLKELSKYKPKKLTLHTRSHLILQDLDLLKEFGDALTIGVSITTDNDSIRKQFEPFAPSINRRLEILKKLSSNGIKVYASLAPLLPCDPENLVKMLSPYVDDIWISKMGHLEVNTKPELLGTHKEFFSAENYSETQNKIESCFKTKNKFQKSAHSKSKMPNRNRLKMSKKSVQLSLLASNL